MSDFTLICDLDGVVLDFDRAWTERHNQWWPAYGAKANAPQRWNELHILGGFTDPSEFWDWWVGSGGFRDVPLYEGAREALWFADDRGWRIVYATNRPVDGEVTLRELIRHDLPQVGSLIHINHKASLAKRYPRHLVVEDGPDNLMSYEEVTPWVLRVERPWNQVKDYPALRECVTIPNLTEKHLGLWVGNREIFELMGQHID